MLTDREIKMINEYLINHISPDVIYLFGSSVKGSMRADSDIDIAFLSEQKYSSYDLFTIGQGLANLLGRDVDLIDLKEASTVFQAQIINTGRVIFSKDENKRMVFQLIALKKYLKLNEERKIILDQIKESGRIYAE